MNPMNPMNIGIVGTGYVGLVSGVCFARLGHTVIGADKRAHIVEALSNKTPTIYEENLADMLAEGVASGRLSFTSSLADLKKCDIIFVAVGTPSLPNGHADLSQIYAALDELVGVVPEDVVIAVRSTIPVGTMRALKAHLEKNKRRNPLGFCPEFLREGVAIADFLHPHKVVLASDSAAGLSALRRAYEPLLAAGAPLICCDQFETAEIIKYASNAFLATKITFINQIAQLSQAAGADIAQISQGMGLDPRIGAQFLQPGPGYGGSCFPKDTVALIKSGLQYGIDISLIEAVHRANEAHRNFVSSWILETLGNAGVHGAPQETAARPALCVWGLAFKANTDDVRDSAALAIVANFADAGFSVRCYDPKGAENFERALTSPHVTLCKSELDAARGAQALVVLTEWPQFAAVPAAEACAALSGKRVFDARNILDAQGYQKAGAQVHKLGFAPAHQ